MHPAGVAEPEDAHPPAGWSQSRLVAGRVWLPEEAFPSGEEGLVGEPADKSLSW
jgi:hypothetical protein